MDDTKDLFDMAVFTAALQTQAVGRQVVYRRTVGSTMDVARDEAAKGAPHGTLVLAEEQVAGRGRRGRGFHSPAGQNIYVTMILRPTLETHRRLPVIVPLAVCEAVRADGVDARIKWPNDIWAGERKLCGMLIDAEVAPGGVVAYPGIGINVNGDPTVIPELQAIATSVARELGHPVVRERLLARLCNCLEELEALPQDDLVGRYRALSLVLGRGVVVAPAKSEPYEAVAEAIDADGLLIVLRADGSRETVNAADVSVRPLA